MPHLIVFSHLRWDFVHQRPQHLLTRLAKHCPVTFIEEPIRTSGPARLEGSSPCEGVRVLRPHTPVEFVGFHDDQLAMLHPLVADYVRDQEIDDYLVWFYTPMALPLIGGMTPRAVVYDCMDELAAFKNAPRQMKQRETALLKMADLVLTGGPSLYESKRAANPNTLCLPSAVDASHYSPSRALAALPEVQRADVLQGHIPSPRLGFFGVIDERIDLKLVAHLADSLPEHHVIMVGPVVKIDPAELPQRANIHWLGSQPYELLPQLVAGWDVCLMPFALNESTAFISPTKTLEYMAAGKPVVSTPIRDVKVLFGDVVRIAHDFDSYVSACRNALSEDSAEACARGLRMQQEVSRYSWDRTAESVRQAINSLTLADETTSIATLPIPTTPDVPDDLFRYRAQHVSAA